MLPTIQTILYATDLGQHAPSAFRYALSLAQQYGARVHVVHAVEPLTGTARQIVDVYAPGELTEAVERERAQKLLAMLRARLEEFCRQETCRTTQCETLVANVDVIEGKAPDVVLGEAKRLGADLIVMGSHGHSTVGEMVLGSVAHRVAQKATVPVLLVRVPEG
jgi:nucleotide-binding universal stress UspA family protein